MDELYILGCLFLVFALVVAPVLALIGFNRSTAAKQEIARLRQRIEALEQRGVAEKVPEPVQAVTPVLEPAAEAVTAPVDPWRPEPPVTEAKPAPVRAAKRPSAFGGILSSLTRMVHAGQSAGEAGDCAALPGSLFPAALYR